MTKVNEKKDDDLHQKCVHRMDERRSSVCCESEHVFIRRACTNACTAQYAQKILVYSIHIFIFIFASFIDFSFCIRLLGSRARARIWLCLRIKTRFFVYWETNDRINEQTNDLSMRSTYTILPYISSNNSVLLLEDTKIQIPIELNREIQLVAEHF